jgi:hypothetical protein
MAQYKAVKEMLAHCEVQYNGMQFGTCCALLWTDRSKHLNRSLYLLDIRPSLRPCSCSAARSSQTGLRWRASRFLCDVMPWRRLTSVKSSPAVSHASSLETCPDDCEGGRDLLGLCSWKEEKRKESLKIFYKLIRMHLHSTYPCRNNINLHHKDMKVFARLWPTRRLILYSAAKHVCC